MKSSLTNSHKLLLGLASAILLLVSARGGKAQVLLTVNINNPSAVTITATRADAGADVSGFLSDGVDLLGFFASTTSTATFDSDISPSSNLTVPNLAGDVFTNGLSDVFSTGDNVDLNLYNYTSSAAENFSTGSVAFTGTLTLNLSGYSAELRSVGTGTYTGTLIAGFFDDGSLGSGTPTSPAIGQYQIVSISAPEPSTWVLLFAGMALLAVRRARLKAQRPRPARI
jgi:hypothetical protein